MLSSFKGSKVLRRIKFWLKEFHLPISFGITALCCVIAFLGAFYLRFDFGKIPEEHLSAMWMGLVIMISIRMVTLLLFRVHRGLYRYASLYDFVQLFKAISVGSVIFLVIWHLLIGSYHVMPRSIYPLDWILCLSLLMGLRIGVRLWRNQFRNKPRKSDSVRITRALIVGAGNLGEAVLRMVDRRFLGQEMHVVGFVDQNPVKQGSYIHGIPVLGNFVDLPEFVCEHQVELILFAIRQPQVGLFEGIVASCDGLGVRFNTVSVLEDAFTGEVSVQQMRELKIEDLLGRKSVKLDVKPVQESLAGKTVMVTGAGGSIGSELCRQIASFSPKCLVLLDNAESPLFEIDRELRQFYPSLNTQPFIGDIKHGDVVDYVFSITLPDTVYHAAAYKHVPLMEAHPDEAVLNNIRGTRQLAETAIRYHCQRFVMISSDKAVRPTNVMGATKRMCELVVQSMNGDKTIFAAVRFGNVLGSNGSVIPIFKKQIEAGGPLTVTDPEMTRFFMTISEAVSLVLQCGVIADPGDIFVLDMGAPVRIMDLARNMLRLSGLRENVDIDIEVTGLRPGEKMYEELVTHGERLVPTGIPKVNVLKKSKKSMFCNVRMALIRRMEEIAEARGVEQVRELLWHLIELDVEEHLTRHDCSLKCERSIIQEWSNALKNVSVEDSPVSRGRVLGVAFKPEEQELLKNTLCAAGYELDLQDSEEDALSLLVSGQVYSVILCNYIMPENTVWHFREKIRAFGFNVPFIAAIPCDGDRVEKLIEIDKTLPVLRKPFLPHEFHVACAIWSPKES